MTTGMPTLRLIVCRLQDDGDVRVAEDFVFDDAAGMQRLLAPLVLSDDRRQQLC
jgi:hypothetical protein